MSFFITSTNVIFSVPLPSSTAKLNGTKKGKKRKEKKKKKAWIVANLHKGTYKNKMKQKTSPLETKAESSRIQISNRREKTNKLYRNQNHSNRKWQGHNQSIKHNL